MSKKLLKTPIALVATGDTMPEQRALNSKKMVAAVQSTFASLILSNQKYVDPSQILNKVVDDQNTPVKMGEQMDVVEYLLNFIERL